MSETSELLRRWPLALQLDLRWLPNVLVVGGYKGVTMVLLEELYQQPRFVVYEPQQWACAEIAKRELPNYILRPVAIGAETGKRQLWEHETDAASFYRTDQRLVGLVDVVDVREEYKLWDQVFETKTKPIDLLLMNCEGAEFELLPILIEDKRIQDMDNLVIQFHFDLGNDEAYMDICRALLQTHTCLRADKDWHWWTRKL